MKALIQVTSFWSDGTRSRFRLLGKNIECASHLVRYVYRDEAHHVEIDRHELNALMPGARVRSTSEADLITA